MPPKIPGPDQLYVLSVLGLTVVLIVTLGLPHVNDWLGLIETLGEVVLVGTITVNDVEHKLTVFVTTTV